MAPPSLLKNMDIVSVLEAHMKKIFFTLIAALFMLMFNSPESHAFHGRHGGHRGHFGMSVWVGPGLWWPYYPHYSYYPPPPVIVQEQPEPYIQEREEDRYWYYCPDSRGYYPYVRKCPNGWMKVVPDSAPPAPEE
jgi:hypothetical protein